MSISEEIKDVLESQLADSEFIVDVILKGAIGTQKLIVLADSDAGMTIERCAEISRYLSSYLEEKELFDTAFTLEVSSPGLDHPLKLKRQYSKNLGRSLRVKTINNVQFEGVLKSVEEDIVILELIDGKGNNPLKQIEIPFAEIDTAMVLVSFSKQG